MWSNFARWLRTRVLRARVLLLWLLALVAAVAAGADRASQRPAVAGLTALWITVFRLWDDLEDQPHDRVHHPERSAPLSVHTRALAALAAAGLVLSGLALWWLRGAVPAGHFALLGAAFVLLYKVLPSLSPRRRLRALLVLMKYPVFVCLLAPKQMGHRALLAGSLLYTLLAMHELRWERPQPDACPEEV